MAFKYIDSITDNIHEHLIDLAGVKIYQRQRAIVFSQLGDRLFDELADKIATRRQYRLLFEYTLKPELFQQIRIAAASYISVCLNSPIILSEAEMLERLLEARNTLIFRNRKQIFCNINSQQKRGLFQPLTNSLK